MARELLEHGVKLVSGIRETYVDLVSDGEEPREAEVRAIDGWLSTNYDILALIWAAGQVSEAYEAVYEEIAQHVYEPFAEE